LAEQDEVNRPADRYAVVIGGSRGIGAETARLLATRGYRVAVSYNKSREQAEKLVMEIQQYSPGSFAFHIDVSDPASVAKARKRVEERFPRIDALVYSAGILQLGGIEELEPSEWDKVLRVNLYGAYYTIREFLPLLRKSRSPAIVAISSIAGETGNVVAGPAYAASKAGLIGLVKRLAVELAPHGIRVNAVAPSFVETDMTREILDDPEKREKIRRLHPLGIILKPRDVAEAILFLLDPEKARGITGHVLSINAGRRT